MANVISDYGSTKTMRDIFLKYKQKRVYKTLAIQEYFIEKETGENILKYWDHAFLSADNLDDAIEVLELKVSDFCIKKLRRRYSKYKSAQKCRSENFSINVSQDTGEKLTIVREKLGLSSYEETIDHMLYELYRWTKYNEIFD